MIHRLWKELLSSDSVQDYGFNGIQVENNGEIKKIAFAVDASLESIQTASNEKCQLLVVHHGLLWGKEMPVTGNYYQRLKLLLAQNIGLIAYHLPLDGHPKIGNNAVILTQIGAQEIIPCSYHKGFAVGYTGKLKKPCSTEEIAQQLRIPEDSKKILKFHEKKIKKVGVVSGSGGSSFPDFLAEEVDLFITGEQDHALYHPAKEANVNILFCGHYYSEIWGIKALQHYTEERLKIETIFCDLPTGL